MAFVRRLWRGGAPGQVFGLPSVPAGQLQNVQGRLFQTAAIGSILYARKSARGATKTAMVATMDEVELGKVDDVNVDVEKRATDTRLYRAITLKNGMRVLLISDKDALRGAAALDVHVGSFSDPADLPGLAHFAEHMCFLGTKKYPEEEEFSRFLSSHGGMSNAYTDSEDTVYFFDCSADSLDGALDRFSQFFVAPLFTESAVSRELNAIDSEHSKNINNDGFRLYQLERDTSNPAHPLNKFSTGNKETLETLPLQHGVNIRNRLIDFHTENYIANRMTLCVLGKQSLNELEKDVTKYFSNVPAAPERPAPTEAWWGKVRPYEQQTEASRLSVVPVGETRRLSLAWPVWIRDKSSRGSILRSKPESIVAHLLGHEGVGSLRSLLVSKGWVNNVGAAISNDVSDLQMFEVNVDLTEAGYNHMDDVAEAVFSYIALLKARPIPQYIFDEVQQLSNIGFKFAEKSEPSSYVSSIAADMQMYAPRSYVSGSRLLDPDAGAVANYLDELSVENCRLKLVASALKGTTDKKGRYYGTDYSLSSLKPQSQRWRKATPQTYPELTLPAPNDFIPTDFKLVSPPAATDAGRLKNLREPPKLVREDEKWTVWYKPDRSFGQPRVYMILNLALPQTQYDPAFAVQSDLFTSCFLDSLSEYLYDARLAGLGFDLSCNPRGLQMVVSGYSDKLDLFAQRVMKKIHSYRPNQASFERFKDLMTRGLTSFKSRQPYQHASYYASQASESLQFSIEDLKDALKKTTLEDLDGFLDRTMALSGGTALVSGNVDAAGAKRLVALAEEEFQFGSLPDRERARRRPVLVPVAMDAEHKTGVLLARQEPNEEDENSAVSFYFQVPTRKVEDYVIVELLADVLEQGFYASLRTQQQLGYIVGAGVRMRGGIRSLTFTAQSAVVDGEELTRRVEEYLHEAVGTEMKNLTEDEFEAFKRGIISKKSEPDQRLTSQCERLWGEILQLPEHEPLFDRQEKEVDAIKRITRTQLQDFATNLLLPGGSDRRLLVSQITAQKKGPEFKKDARTPTRVGYEEISDEAAWMRSQEML